MRRAAWGVIVVLLATAGGCRETTGARSGRGAGGMGDPLVVGVAWPFSAKKDRFREGVNLAVADINAAGGVLGRPLAPVFSDDGGTVRQGTRVAQAFAERGDMMAVIGHFDAHIAQPVSLTYEYNGLLLLTPGATDPQLTQQGFRKVFRLIPSDNEMGRQLAQIAARLGYRRLAVVHEQTNYGRQLANAVEFSGEAEGLTVVDRLSYDSGVYDYRALFNRLRLVQIDAVCLAGHADDAAAIIAEARERGVSQPFFGANGLDNPSLFDRGVEAVEGTLVLSVFDRHNPSPYVQFFNRRFVDTYDALPDAWAAQGYDAVQILARAVREAQSTDPTDVADAMRGIQAWYGVTGRHDFDDSGEVHHKPMVMKIAHAGKLSFFSF